MYRWVFSSYFSRCFAVGIPSILRLSVVYRFVRLLLAHGFNFPVCVYLRPSIPHPTHGIKWTAAHSYLFRFFCFVPAEKNQFITCNLINFLISYFFVFFFFFFGVFVILSVLIVFCSFISFGVLVLLCLLWMSTHERCWTWNECDFIRLEWIVSLFCEKWRKCSIDGIVTQCEGRRIIVHGRRRLDEHMLSLQCNQWFEGKNV